jgi:anti-sigma B factor antagonist
MDDEQVAMNGSVAMPARIDVASSSTVRAALNDALDAREGDLVIDLRGVEVVDAAGLGVLVGVRRRADAAGRVVVLRHTPPRVQRLLNATHLTRLFVLD